MMTLRQRKVENGISQTPAKVSQSWIQTGTQTAKVVTALQTAWRSENVTEKVTSLRLKFKGGVL